MAVNYHLGAFPPATLDWPRLLPLIGPANAVENHLLTTNGFVNHKNDFVSHKVRWVG